MADWTVLVAAFLGAAGATFAGWLAGNKAVELERLRLRTERERATAAQRADPYVFVVREVQALLQADLPPEPPFDWEDRPEQLLAFRPQLVIYGSRQMLALVDDFVPIWQHYVSAARKLDRVLARDEPTEQAIAAGDVEVTRARERFRAAAKLIEQRAASEVQGADWDQVGPS